MEKKKEIYSCFKSKIKLELEKIYNKIKSFYNDNIKGKFKTLLFKTEKAKRNDFRAKKIETKYVKDLQQHIKDGCLNIGLIGDYATGKSSIIKSLKDQTKKVKFIELSSINKKPQGIDNDSKKIEQIFIHQLHNVLSDSNSLNRKLKLNKKFICKNFFNILLVFIFIIIVLNITSQYFYGIYLIDKIKTSNVIVTHEKIFKLIVDHEKFIKFTVYILPLIILSGIILKNSIQFINSIQISGKNKNINLDFDKRIISNEFITKETQLIIELIKEIKTRKRLVVIIEDIDRFGSEEIFRTFHDVSKIINSNKKLKGKINFIYAIKATMLKDDATKYFDAIVDVIPFYDRLVASNYLQELLGSDNKLDKKFLNTICYYISDYRDLLRIANLFIDYKETFIEIENLEKLMSIVFLKVLYPEYLNLKPLNEKIDSLEGLLELLDAKKSFEKEISYLIKNPAELGKYEVYFDEYKKKIKGYDKNLWNIVEYLISRKYLDNNYSWIISMISNNFSVEDRNFITNLLDKTNRIFRDPNTFEISDKEKVIDEYIDEMSLLYSIELINIDLLRYFISKKYYVENSYNAEVYANNMITNIINNNKIEELLLINNKDIISNKNSFATNLNKKNIELIIEFIEKNYNIGLEKLDNFFNLNNLIYGIVINELDKGCMNEDIMSEILNFLESKEGIIEEELFFILEVRVLFHLKTTNLNVIEEEKVYNTNLYELTKESIEFIINSDKIENKNQLFEYVYEEVSDGKKIEDLEDKSLNAFIEYFIKENQTIRLTSFKNICSNNNKVKIDNILELKEKSLDVYKYIISNLILDLNLENLETLFKDNNESINLIIEEDKVLNLILNSYDELQERENLIKYIIKNYHFDKKQLKILVNKLEFFDIKYDIKDGDEDEKFLETILPIIRYSYDNLEKIKGLDNEDLILQFTDFNIEEIKEEEAFEKHLEKLSEEAYEQGLEELNAKAKSGY